MTIDIKQAIAKQTHTQESHRLDDVAGDLTGVRHITEPLDDCIVIIVHPFDIRFGRFNSLLN